MKKGLIAIAIGLILAAFAAADFYLNSLGKNIPLDFGGGQKPPVAAPAEVPVPILSAFKVGDVQGGFKVIRQMVTAQVFDKVDLSPVKNIRVYKTLMEKSPVVAQAKVEKAGEEGATEKAEPAPVAEPIWLYEIVGARNQGGLTYLAVKLQFIAQINATTETINEDSQYGDSSFFYNDMNLQSTGFLLTQIGDTLYGFQYGKKNSATYEVVKKIIEDLTSKK
jgi:hypothetical protein